MWWLHKWNLPMFEVADKMDTQRDTLANWIDRFELGRVAGIQDKP